MSIKTDLVIEHYECIVRGANYKTLTKHNSTNYNVPA